MKLSRRGLFSLVAGLPLVKKLAAAKRSEPEYVMNYGLFRHAYEIIRVAEQRGIDRSQLLWVGAPSFRAAILMEGVARIRWAAPEATGMDLAPEPTIIDLTPGLKRKAILTFCRLPCVTTRHLRHGAYLCQDVPNDERPGRWVMITKDHVVRVLEPLFYDIPPGYEPLPQTLGLPAKTV